MMTPKIDVIEIGSLLFLLGGVFFVTYVAVTGSSSNAYFSLSSLHSRSSRAPIVLLALPIQYIRYNLRLGQGDSDC